MKKLLFFIILIAGVAFILNGLGQGAVKDNVKLENETLALRKADDKSKIVDTNAINVSDSEKQVQLLFIFRQIKSRLILKQDLKFLPGMVE